MKYSDILMLLYPIHCSALLSITPNNLLLGFHTISSLSCFFLTFWFFRVTIWLLISLARQLKLFYLPESFLFNLFSLDSQLLPLAFFSRYIFWFYYLPQWLTSSQLYFSYFSWLYCKLWAISDDFSSVYDRWISFSFILAWIVRLLQCFSMWTINSS